MKNLYFLFFLLLVGLFIFSCEVTNSEKDIDNGIGEGTPPDSTSIGDNGMSQEQLVELDNLPSPPYVFEEIVLPSGLTIKEFKKKFPNSGRVNKTLNDDDPIFQKDNLVRKMLEKAHSLTIRADFVKPDEGINKPAQPNGLAYGFGNKNHTGRKNPAGPIEEEVYGLDCSGFLKLLFDNGGLTKMPAGPAEDQRSVIILKKALESANLSNKMVPKDLGFVHLDQLESGDILYWENNTASAFHIGLVFAPGGQEPMVYQSNGSDAATCKDKTINIKEQEACIIKEQESNRGTNRGPRWIALSQSKIYFGQNYRVVRLMPIVKDIEGNEYPISKIGNQYWMGQNLRTKKYATGELIFNAWTNTLWVDNNDKPAMCYQGHSIGDYIWETGVRYNWHAVADQRKICPKGWHIPSEGEWQVLIGTLGGGTVAGLKMIKNNEFFTPSSGATNSSGFSAIAVNYRARYGPYVTNPGEAESWWWSITPDGSDKDKARNLVLKLNNGSLDFQSFFKATGFCVRCLKD